MRNIYMTIHKYTNSVELKVGQWINCEGLLYGSFASRPSIIREIKKASIVTERCHRIRNSSDIEWEPKTYRKTSIRYVCNTEEEANIMREYSSAFLDFQFEAERKFKEQMQVEQNRFIQEALDKARKF